MMVTALISVARNDRQAAHHGTRRRARKKSAVSCCARAKTNPMARRTARAPATTA
jgi:hypothetical protein